MDDNFINIPIDIYAEATTKNKLKDMETVRKVVERFGNVDMRQLIVKIELI